MHPECFESGPRRAEIYPGMVCFMRITGNIRKTKQGVWRSEYDDIRSARRMAKNWTVKAKLPRVQ